MRAVVGLLVLAGCGRIGFDGIDDSGANGTDDGAILDDSGVPLPPLTCSRATTTVTNASADVHLVATEVTGGGAPNGIAVAWVSSSGGRVQIMRLSGGGTTGLGQVDGTTTVHNRVGSIMQSADTLLVQASNGTAQEIMTMSSTLTGVGTLDTAAGTIGHGCLLRDVNDNVTMHITANGTQLSAAYVTSTIGAADVRDVGETILDLSCHLGPDHIHVGWSGALGSCSGAAISYGGVPTISGTSAFESDCVGVRSTALLTEDDTSEIIWRRASGAITTAYFFTTPQNLVDVSTNSDAYRVASDGTIAWFAWLEGGTVHVAHKVPTADAVDGTAALTGVVPAGNEAFVIERIGGSVFLIVLTPASTLQVYKLCAN